MALAAVRPARPARAIGQAFAASLPTDVDAETGDDGSPGPGPLTLRDRPFAPEGRLLVLYDGECGFCRSVAIHLRRWDRRDRLVPIPLQDAPAAGSSLARAASEAFDLSRELTVVDEATGLASQGGDAVLTLVDALPVGRLMRPAWSDPPFLWTMRAAYRLVARHRARLAMFGLDAPAGAGPGRPTVSPRRPR